MSIPKNDKTAKLNGLIEQQENLLEELKQGISEIDTSEIIAENKKLKQDIEEINNENKKLSDENSKLSSNLEATKTALFTKMANEKLSAFKRTQAQIDNFYYKEESEMVSRLDDYKNKCIANIGIMRNKIEKIASDDFNDISARLFEVEEDFHKKQEALHWNRLEEQKKLRDANNAFRGYVENEPLTETEKKVAVRQKNIETFIGLNVLSKAGIVLFLIGIIALGRFAYTRLPDLFKALMIYVLGGGLIGIGELFHKKEKTVFSTALISGGVAVLYAGVATSYFALELFSVKVAFLLCVAVTAIAIALSLQLKNQVVCAFGAVGGYLPLVATYMISFGNAAADKTFLPVSAVYFCLLAVIIFVMTYNKKWYVTQFIGYAFQMLAVIGVSSCSLMLSKVDGYKYALPLSIVFSVASFVIYMMMPAVKIMARKELATPDCVLLGLNTVSGAISVSVNMYNLLSSKKAVGLTFLAFSVIYAILASRMNRNKKKSPTNIATKAVLMLGALVFSMFVVPMILGVEYIGIAWVTEGAIIAVVSIIINSRLTEAAGVITMIMALAYRMGDTDNRLIVISATIIIATFWAYTFIGCKYDNIRNGSQGINTYYTLMIVALGIGTMIYGADMYDIVAYLPQVLYVVPFINKAILIIIALVISVVSCSGVARSEATLVYSGVIRFVTFFAVAFNLNIVDKYSLVFDSFGNEAKFKYLAIINAVMLVLVNVVMIILLADITNKLLNTFNLPVWIYTAVLSVSSLILITSVLMGQFDVKFTNVLISAIYIAFACVLLYLGFKNRYTVVRFGGLILVLCALAKLCFVDTHSLNTIWKIGAYFAFGAVLIVISYVYQKFNKKLEKESLSTVTKEDK